MSTPYCLWCDGETNGLGDFCCLEHHEAWVMDLRWQPKMSHGQANHLTGDSGGTAT